MERTDKGQAYLDDIYAAYPDLDASTAPAYAKTRINFSTGKEAAGINSSNTAIHHLNRMDANLNQATAGYTGSVEQFFGANPATVLAGARKGTRAIPDVDDLARGYCATK